MIMLIHKICMALRGLGKFINVANEINVNAAILLLKKVILHSCQHHNFWGGGSGFLKLFGNLLLNISSISKTHNTYK